MQTMAMNKINWRVENNQTLGEITLGENFLVKIFVVPEVHFGVACSYYFSFISVYHKGEILFESGLKNRYHFYFASLDEINEKRIGDILHFCILEKEWEHKNKLTSLEELDNLI